MTRPTRLRISGVHVEQLRKHLFPGDGNEAVAFALCGRHRGKDADFLLIQEVHPVPHADCPIRQPDLVTWETRALEPLLLRAAQASLGLVKFHSHPTGYAEFSRTDDVSDRNLFESVYGWVDDEGPHGSVVMLPDGTLFGRSIDSDTTFHPLDRILVVDHNIDLFSAEPPSVLPAHAQRHAQMFGERTTNVLRQLTVGVVGCSGTGSLERQTARQRA